VGVYYPQVMMFCCICLVALAFIVNENSRLSTETKRRFIQCYEIIFLTIFTVLINALFEGKPEYIIAHKCSKFVDFVLTPIINLFFLKLLTKKKKILYPLRILLFINSIFVVVNLFTGWIYTINDANVFIKGRYYIIYECVYVASSLYLVAEFIFYGRRHPNRNGFSLFCIFFIIGGSMFVQQVFGINIAGIGLAFGSALIFIHYSEFYQQNNDIVLSAQEKLIRTDVLTQIQNRYAYTEKAREFYTNGVPKDLVVFSIDLNGLKKINDTQGHEYGDHLITSASSIITSVFSKYGTTYRIGGDEFMVIIENTKVFPGELGEQLEKKTAEYKSALVDEVSLSYGYVCAKDYPDMDFESLTNVADKRMYEDKAEHYLHRGFDRRSIQDAYDAISSTYVKVLKVNLNDDTFQVVSLGSNAVEKDSVYSSTISGWTKDFVADSNVHPDDIVRYLNTVNVGYLRDYFDKTRETLIVEYRRRVDFIYKNTLLEIIPTEGYSDNNRTVFIFVKYLSSDTATL